MSDDKAQTGGTEEMSKPTLFETTRDKTFFGYGWNQAIEEFLRRAREDELDDYIIKHLERIAKDMRGEE